MLTLYVAGRTPLSGRAIGNLGRLFERSDVRSRFDWEVVDILEHPDAAEKARILVTPTLVKATPPPRCLIFGDLSETESLLSGLGIP